MPSAGDVGPFRRDLAAGRARAPLAPAPARDRPRPARRRRPPADARVARAGTHGPGSAPRTAAPRPALGLLGFLDSTGSASRQDDVAALGAWPGEPARPSGRAPVPAWRSSPRLCGRRRGRALADARSPGRTRPFCGKPSSTPSNAAWRRRGGRRRDGPGGADGDGRPELAAEFARRGGSASARDLAGFAFPCPFVDLPDGGGPVSSVGAAAAWLARGAARREETPSFVECGPGSALEDGAALRRLAGLLDGDPRAGAVRTLADGGRPPRRDEGPDVAVVALEAERWDPRSRRALSEALPAHGLPACEAWSGSPAALGGAGSSRFASPTDAASLVYLPFVSLSAALEAWAEARGLPP